MLHQITHPNYTNIYPNLMYDIEMMMCVCVCVCGQQAMFLFVAKLHDLVTKKKRMQFLQLFFEKLVQSCHISRKKILKSPDLDKRFPACCQHKKQDFSKILYFSL
jgi:hypothetical protein